MSSDPDLLIWRRALIAFSFVLGSAVGSFLNVCIWRIPRDESVVRPRSHCPRCGAPIAWYDNIPILSWILLRGRCRHCAEPISPRYLVVELLTAVLFAMIGYRYGWSPLTAVYALAASGLILGSFVDLDHLYIPDRVTIGGMLVGLALSAAVPQLHSARSWLEGLSRGVVGMLSGLVSLWLVAKIGTRAFKKEAMGLGDVKLLGAIGAFLGWQAVAFTLIAASFAGSMVGFYLIAKGKAEWGSRIPFGPFLSLGAILWILGGDIGWHAYFSWLFAPAGTM